MSQRHHNLLLLVAVALISALPLCYYQPADGEAAFAGADARAQAQIGQLAPDYRPWFKPLLEPASDEIASLLFALQAAIGAGVIGYWLGSAVSRDRLRRELAARPTEPAATPAAVPANERARNVPTSAAGTCRPNDGSQEQPHAD